MNYAYPLAVLSNSFAMTAFYIFLALIGMPELAADICIVQGATFALFFSFSANARNIILNPSSNNTLKAILLSRLLLSLPLGAVAFYLSTNFAHVDVFLSFFLIVRRIIEWIGELHISEMEFQGRFKFPLIFVFVQFVLFFIALIWISARFSFPLFGLTLWAVIPLLISLKFIVGTLKDINQKNINWNLIVPNFGSSAITGITVFVFRLLIISIVGKIIAGDLFTAFALGGFIGSLFTYAIGPSIAFYEKKTGQAYLLPVWFKISLIVFLLGGISLLLGSAFNLSIFSLTSKSLFFWDATGLSMIGGVIMVFTQRIRISILQHYENRDVFGPDLIVNLIFLASVPLSYYLIGGDALKGLYLYNAFIGFLFYFTTKRKILFHNVAENSWDKYERLVRIAIACILISPVFFQLSGNIFRNSDHAFDSFGNLSQVPLPFSIFACLGGVILIGDYVRSKLSLNLIFCMFILMLWSVISTTLTQSINERDKIILMFQFILPMFSMVLGQMYESQNPISFYPEKASIFVLYSIIPFQLFLTWRSGTPLITPNLYLFSIYQNLQYVSVIFICLYLFVLYSLYRTKNYKIPIISLAPLMGFYAVLSTSMLAIFILFFGIFIFVLLLYRKKHAVSIFLSIAIIISSAISFGIAKNDNNFSKKFSLIINDRSLINDDKSSKLIDKIPNLNSRIGNWKFYLNGIGKNVKNIFWGLPSVPDRKDYTSAHNFYLDVVYNFGIISLIPILFMLAYSIEKIYKLRSEIMERPGMIGLVLITMFLLLIDNSFKVGLRQPYPGIITYFLWGLLLSRLSIIQNNKSIDKILGLSHF